MPVRPPIQRAGHQSQGRAKRLGQLLVSCCHLSLKDPTCVLAHQVGMALCCMCCQGSRELGGELYLRWVRGGRCVGRLDGYRAVRDAAFALAGKIHFGWAPGERQSRQEDHGNAEQMQNVEMGAPHTAYTCNSVPALFILTGDKGEGQAKYTLKADAEGGTCTAR
ncbi:hypothetical protein B0H14DRAFT_3667257 [Mycena olivaceomarginata]|nr:hypothetical protein B0H14DRAFT_3667257 [Mycena olivaceomarginata]